MLRQNSADKLGVGDGARIVTMDTERGDAPLINQSQDLSFDFGGVVEDRIRLTPGHERAVIAVAPIGEALGDIRPLASARLDLQQTAGQSDQR